MNTAVIILNKSARPLAEKISEYLQALYGDSVDILGNPEVGGLKDLTASVFHEYQGLVFIMAAGIVVRMIAPYITDKYRDPAVVVLDDACRHAISLLSGHEGGANNLACRVAAAAGAVPVITTGTETNKKHTIGIGCRRGTSHTDIVEAVRKGCSLAGISPEALRCAASMNVKADEPGLLRSCEELRLPLRFFSPEELNTFTGDFEENRVTVKNLGVKAVAEPCALLAGRNSRLLLKKTIINGVTVAVAEENKEEHSMVPEVRDE